MRRRLYRHYLNMSISSKLLLWMTLAVLLSSTVVSFIAFNCSARDMREKAVSSTQDLVLYVSTMVQSEQQYLYGIAAYCAGNDDVQTLMRASNANLPISEEWLFEDLLNVSLSRMHILSLSFYDRNGKVLAYETIDQSYGALNQDAQDIDGALGTLFSGRYTYIWRYVPQNSDELYQQDNSPKICLWYVVRDNDNYRPIGAVCLTLDTRKLLRMEYSVDQTYYSQIFILDNNGNMVINRGDTFALTEEDLGIIMAEVNPYANVGSFSANLYGKKCDVVYARIQETDGYITFAILDDLNFPFDALLFWKYCVIGLSAVLLLLLPLTLFVSRTLSRPLRHLLHSMSQFKDGNRSAHANLHYCDEIGQLGAMFNEMVEQNNRLVEDTYMLTIKRQAAELTALSVQIKPHFLCKTMHMIQWAALECGAEEIAEMSYYTGQIFQLTLNHGSYFLTLDQERALLEYYLCLQQKRLQSNLAYALNFEAGILDVQVPKLLIQPLVENSIVHGMNGVHSHIRICVSVEAHGEDRISIRVEDDGIGISAEMLSRLPEGASATGRPGRGYALKNIADRLRLFYGEGEYVYRFASIPDEGTTVFIDIPRTIRENFVFEEGAASCSG